MCLMFVFDVSTLIINMSLYLKKQLDICFIFLSDFSHLRSSLSLQSTVG